MYDLGKVGRFKLNRKLFTGNFLQSKRILQPEDVLGTLSYMFNLSNKCDKVF